MQSFSSPYRRGLPAAVALPILVAGAFSSAGAQIPGVDWEPAEAVVSGLDALPSSAGTLVIHSTQSPVWDGPDEWHLTYARDGEIFHQVRGQAGWGDPAPLSSDPADSRDPKLAFAEDWLHVVWEDDRTGHAEVWARRFDGTTWTPEECLTCDPTESRAPVVAGRREDGMVVWQEGPDGASQIHGRVFDGGAWGPSQPISLSPAAASEPAVSGNTESYFVVWADTRHGDPEIYARRTDVSGSWQPEERITDMAGASRRPDVYDGYCCGDIIAQEAEIVFENDQTGVTETWLACWSFPGHVAVTRISEDDLVPSVRPSIDGYPEVFSTGGVGGVAPRWFITWTDDPGGGRAHRIADSAQCGGLGGEDQLSTAGLAVSHVGAACTGLNADILALWLEERDGSPTLLSQLGSTECCEAYQFGGPPSFLLSPRGFPADTLTAVNACGPVPVEGTFVVEFDSFLDQQLTWDPSQEHPVISEAIDEEGRAIFSIRGGGCSESGTVSARLGPITVFQWPGAKSPDVDGNCEVTFEDLIYVSVHVGSSDFCADLDGSGLVDDADVAIVEATLGDRCLEPGSVDEGPVSSWPETARVDITPNPIRETAAFSIELKAPGSVTLQIVDAGGRRIRQLGTVEIPGHRAVVGWDTRDDWGREVPSGVYLLRIQGRRQSSPTEEALGWPGVRGARIEARATLLLLRS